MIQKHQTEDEKRKSFCVLLERLSSSVYLLKDEVVRNNVYNEFEELYDKSATDGFRHFYSDIFNTLTGIKESTDEKDLETLLSNLNYLRENYSPHYDTDEWQDVDITAKLKKLFDHVNLEVSRLNYSDSMYEKAVGNDKFDEMKKELALLNDELSKAKQKNEQMSELLDESKEELNRSRLDVVAIIGLFSGLIIAFFGGFNFVTSALASLSESDMFKIAFIVSLAGFVTFNLIYVLFKVVARIVGRDLHDWNSNFPEYVVAINVVLIIVMIISAGLATNSDGSRYISLLLKFSK